MPSLSFVAKIRLGFAVVIVFMIILVSIGMYKVSVIDETLRSVSQEAALKQRYAINFRGSVHDRAISIRDAVLVTAERDLAHHLADIDRLAEFYTESAEPMRIQLSNPETTDQERYLMERINEIETRALAVTSDVIGMREQGNIDAARTFLLKNVAPAYSEWLTRINAFIDYQEAKIETRVGFVQEAASAFAKLMAVVTVVATLVCFAIAYKITASVRNSLGADPARLREVAQSLAQENYAVRFPRDAQANSVIAVLKLLADKLAKTQELTVENSRICQALDGTSVNVMIADNDRKIVYLNKSVQLMLRETESEMRATLPNFRADRLLGENMDVFHKNPAHQANLLANLKTTYEANIVVGKLHFRLTASPIHDDQGNRIGSVVEWLDRTAEVRTEQEIQALVDAAVAGDFSQRLPEGNKQGFMLNMTKGLNRIVTDAEQGLKDIERIMTALSQGDLTQRIEADYQGMFNQIKNAANDTTTNLSRMIGDIREAVDTISTASAEIASGNSDLSSRTEQQAANLEETASSMEELTGTVRLNADNAGQATGLASKASTVAVEGGELIDKVVGTMASINESAQKISDIIGVIDGIAFQTNILALNAAVEAARAGDQGRGFAVVASEVRSLAQRSANAAKDIKALISDSVQKIADGNGLVNQSGNTMKEIVTAIKRVNDIMAEIAAASAEQASGIDEIGKAVTQMDEMTQQNAALVEEAAAAAESLQSQSDQLAGRVATFRISGMAMSSGNTLSPAPQLVAPRKPGAAAPRLSKNASTGKSSLATRQSASQDDEWEDF